MEKILKYKDYIGSVNKEDNVYWGELMGLEDTFIAYEGLSMRELKEDFIDSVDEYLDLCNRHRIIPEKPNFKSRKGA